MESSKFLKAIAILILGIIICLIGYIFPARYEKAKENGYEVEATVVEVEPREKYDYAMEIYETIYAVYADYEVDGKKYEHVEVGKYDTADEYYEGKVIKVVVNPDSPGKVMEEGGILCVVGFILAIVGIVRVFRLTIGGIVSKMKDKKST